MVPKRLLALALLLIAWSFSSLAEAMPAFARQYNFSCQTCHSAFPKLNAFGEQFAGDMNMRMPNWRDNTVEAGDEMLALPKQWPVAVRAQGFVQGRESEAVDPVTGETEADASTDFQAPYLIKLLSSAPLSEHVTFYFYGIMAEKGENGEFLIEDAWFNHDDVFGTGIGAQLGQFQISDLMFPREVRLTFQDFQAYRMAGITYDRGVLFGRDAGPVDLALGFTNGNGIKENVSVNSPGFRRPDHLFDNDSGKTIFGRIGTELAGVDVGLFGLDGEQRNATGPAGTLSGARDTTKRIVGLDLAGRIGPRTHWYAQWLENRWDGFLQPDVEYEWSGGFAGLDYIAGERWAFSLLYNYADAGDFDGTDTVYEGIDINSLTFTSAYYLMRNLKFVMEVNADLLDEEVATGQYAVGHQTGENYVLVGFDAAF